MKKSIILLAITMVASVALAGKVPQGAGATGTATTTPVVVLVPGTNYCSSVSINNTGDVPIRFIKKLTTGATTNGFVASTAMVVPATGSYTCSGGTITNEEKQRFIYAIVLATESGTAAYSINFE